MQIIRIIKNFLSEIEQEFGISINYNTLTYTRFLTHIRYMVARIYHDDHLEVDMNSYTKTNFPYSYNKAIELINILSKTICNDIKDSEIGYLALHIERITQSIIENET